MIPSQNKGSDADVDSEDDEPVDLQSMSNVEQMIDEITKEKVPKKRKFLKKTSDKLSH